MDWDVPLVRHLLAAHQRSPVVVSTSRDNVPARRLYAGLGFTLYGEAGVLPGLWKLRYRLCR